MATREHFDVIVAAVINLEGGLSLDPEDTGNWTGGAKGKGELRGTKFGISAASFPTLDIPNLTVEQAKDIYHDHYWLRAGCDMLHAPFAAVVFDTAVNSGVGTANRLVLESSGLLDFIGRRFLHYASLTQWDRYGRGWTRRFAEIVRLAGFLADETPGKRPTETDALLLIHESDGTEAGRVTIPAGADLLIRVRGANRIYARPDKP